MSGQPAARLGDTIICSVPQTTPAALPHAPPPGLPILPPCAPTVLIGKKPAARMGDQSMCIAPAPLPNPIMKGAFPVPILNMPAARVTDSGTHPGSIVMAPGCPTVLIGLSGTTGNVLGGTAACQALGGGRTSGTQGQSYNNCGIESSRQIINHATNSNVSEDALMQFAKNTPSINTGSGIGAPGGANVFAEGGTTPPQQAAILTQSGIPSSEILPPSSGANLSQFELPMSQGRGIIAHGDVSGMPATMGYTGAGSHAVTVTGLEYDDAGNLTNVHYNDTNSMCGQTMTATQFQTFMNTKTSLDTAGGFRLSGPVVTNNPVW